jgi:hypothetical protein
MLIILAKGWPCDSSAAVEKSTPLNPKLGILVNARKIKTVN